MRSWMINFLKSLTVLNSEAAPVSSLETGDDDYEAPSDYQQQPTQPRYAMPTSGSADSKSSAAMLAAISDLQKSF